MTDSQSVGILISQAALDNYGARIRAAIEPIAPLRYIVHDADRRLDAEALAQVRAAYFSDELFGRRGEANPLRRPQAFLGELMDAPALQWVHVCSSGTDHPVFRALHERGVTVTNSAGANALAVAHTAVAGMLALARDVPLWVRTQARHEWWPQRHDEAPADLDGTTVVVVGTGAIGQAIARICRAMGMTAIGVRRQPQPMPDFDEVHGEADLEAVLPRADWLVLACPLTDTTRNLVNARRLALLPAGARLVNIGRGPLVDEAALLAALQSGQLAGAYSDVFVTEPLPADSPLWDAPNLLISAHSGGAGKGFGQRVTDRFIGNLRRWLSGEPLDSVARF